MRQPFAFLLLVLQLVFAGLPGDGVVLCVSGEHGALGLCGHLGCEHTSDALEHHAETCDCHPGEPCECPPDEPCDGCDGVHLSRGALEPWQSNAAPDQALAHARVDPARLALIWQPEHLSSCQVDPRRARSPGRVPPPFAYALEVVRVTELRI